MCGSMVDIQSATAENMREKRKKEERRIKPQLQNIMSASATQGSHNNHIGLLVYTFVTQFRVILHLRRHGN